MYFNRKLMTQFFKKNAYTLLRKASIAILKDMLRGFFVFSNFVYMIFERQFNEFQGNFVIILEEIPIR